MNVDIEQDTYPRPRHGWTCFHCGEHFKGTDDGEAEARAHFGPTPDWSPLCIERRLQSDDALLMEARRSRDEAARLRLQVDEQAQVIASFVADLKSQFSGAQTVHEAWCRLDAMEGRAIAAEETLQLLASSRFKFRSKTSEYRIWQQMNQRCNNEKHHAWKDYGGRGIRVCERWRFFELFIADMGQRPTSAHTLDRYPDNNGNYEPGNCRWATRKEQARNRRTNRLVEVDGVVRPLIEWAEMSDIVPETIAHRLGSGHRAAAAVTKPPSANGVTRRSARVGSAEWSRSKSSGEEQTEPTA